MLGRTPLYIAPARARQLVVIVGQKRALALAVRDWRRTARQTALAGLLTGVTRFVRPRTGGGAVDPGDDGDPDAWGGLVGDAPQ
jgi:hypothetical protein